MKWINVEKERASFMLIGEFYHNIDLKGRMIIPTKFRDDLGGNFVMSKGLDNCLYVYSLTEWKMFENELLSMRSPDARKLHRFFFSGATECEIDSQGRVVIPSNFREYACLKKELVILGVSNRAEIWDRERWTEYMNDPSFEPDEIAKTMDKLMF